MKRRRFCSPILPVGLVVCFAASILAQGVQIETPPPVQQGSPGSEAPHTPTAAEALYDYLQKYHLEVIKDNANSKYIWTDRAFIEIGDRPPPEPLAGLLANAPNNNGEFATWVHDTYETQLKGWHAAKKNPRPSKPGTDEMLSAVGKDRCFVNPVYVSYVMSRYPEAGILMKGPKDAVLFTVKGKLKAIVSPWTKLPDGTPLL